MIAAMMHARSALPSCAAAILVSLAGAASIGCRGIDADVQYPNDLPSIDNQLQTPEGESGASVTLGAFKFAPSVCQGIDVHAATSPLTPDDLATFLQRQGANIPSLKARPDLFWFDFPNGEQNGKLRVRVAVLPSAALAAK